MDIYMFSHPYTKFGHAETNSVAAGSLVEEITSLVEFPGEKPQQTTNYHRDQNSLFAIVMKDSHTKSGKQRKLFRKLAGIGISLAALSLTISIFYLLDLGKIEPTQASGGLTGLAQNPEEAAQPFVPGRVIFRLKDGFRKQAGNSKPQIPELNAALAPYGAQKFRHLFPNTQPIGDTRNALGQSFEDLSLIYEVVLAPETNVLQLVQELRQLSCLRYAEPRYIYTPFYTPDDQKVAQQNYLAPVKAFQAWDIEKGDSVVVIGIIDTGTSFTHPDLKDKVALNPNDPIDGIDNDGDGYTDNYRGWDFGGSSFNSGGDNDPTFAGSGGGIDHGVLVAGPAAAATDNGTGIASIGFNTSYLPLKASQDGSTGISYGFDAIVYAADRGVNILNLSWGYSGFSQFGEDICNYAAINKGCLLVAAAGNTPTDLQVFPASYDHVMSVGGTQRGYNPNGVLEDDHVWESNASFGTSYNYGIDVMAPARNVRTTAQHSTYWGGATGTSLAAPIVAGGAALVKAHFPTYTNRQCGELLRVTADDIYAINSGSKYEGKLGKGRINLLAALTTSSPSVRIDSLVIADGQNNLPEPLDTLDIYPRLINYLAPTQGLTINLDVSHTPFLEVINGSISPGALGTLNSVIPQTPFRVVVKRDCPTDFAQWLRFEFTDAATSYNDFQYREIPINASWVDLDQNNITTSLTSDGRIGFVDYPTFEQGLGLGYQGFGNALGLGGFLMGTSSSKLSDGLRDQTHSLSQDLVPISKIIETSQDPRADQVTTLEFDDSGSPRPLDLKVKRESFVWNDPGREDFVILEYTLSNEGNSTLNGISTGLLLSWNPSSDYLAMKTDYDAVNQTIFAEFTGLNGNVGKDFLMGLSLLSDQTAIPFNETLAGFSFSENDKFDALTSTAPVSNINAHLIQSLSVGSLNLKAGESVTVAFALVGGLSEADISTHSALAYEAYHCELKNNLAQPDLGNDLFLCDSDPITLNASDPNGKTYVWSDGSTSPSLQVNQSGRYFVEVFNEKGCSKSDTVQVTYLGTTSNIMVDKTTAEVGTALNFASDAPTSTLTWTWDFGDGSPLNFNANPSHTYQVAGTYTITLITGNGYCMDTVFQTVEVKDRLTSLEDLFENGVMLYPNPVAGPVTLEISGLLEADVEVDLQDLNGRSLVRKTFRAAGNKLREQIDLSLLPAGTYLTRIRANGKYVIRKLIKQ